MLNTTHTAPKPNGHQLQNVPLYIQLRAAVLTRIEAGEWRPEQPIPNEGELSREFGVSAGTMRKALDLLEADKVLIRKQGRGTFVLDKDAEDLDRIASCYWKLEKTAQDARYVTVLVDAHPTEPQAMFKHRLAQIMFKAKNDFTKECPEADLPRFKRTLLLVAHEELAAAYLKDHPNADPKEARAKTKDQVRDHLLMRDEQAALPS